MSNPVNDGTLSSAQTLAAQNAMAISVASSLSKVPVTLQIVLGSARLPLADLMSLKPGSEIKLEARPGEAVTVLVNGCKIAKGELYVLESDGDKFGVKISELFESALPL